MRARSVSEERFTRGGDPYKKMGLGRHSEPLYPYWAMAKESVFFAEVSDMYDDTGYEGPTRVFDIVSRLDIEGRYQKVDKDDTWSITYKKGHGISVWYMGRDGGIETELDGSDNDNIRMFKAITSCLLPGDEVPSDWTNENKDWKNDEKA